MKKVLTVMLLTLLTLVLSGCWSKRELNELAIAMALGVDKVDDEYEISIQIVDPSEISSKQPSSGRSPVITYHAKGKTVFEAIRKMTTLLPRKPYFSHLQMVVIGEELASEGISQTLDFLARDHEFRNDFDVIVAHKTTAKEVVNILTPIEKIPANNMLNTIKVSQKSWGSTLPVNISELINMLNSDEKSAVLSAIEIHGNQKLGIDQTNVERIDTPVILQFTGLAVFKQDKLIGVLTEDESKSYNFLNDKIVSTLELISCPENGKLSTEITNAKTTIKGKIENGTPKVRVHVDVNQNVAEVECTINLAEKATIHMINEETEKVIKEKIEQFLVTIQQRYQVDVLGFSEVIHRKDANEWKKIKDDWPTIFLELEVKVEVNVDTQGLGTMQNSMLYKSKE